MPERSPRFYGGICHVMAEYVMFEGSGAKGKRDFTLTSRLGPGLAGMAQWVQDLGSVPKTVRFHDAEACLVRQS